MYHKRQTDFSRKWKFQALLTIFVLLLVTEELCVYNAAKMKPLQNDNEFGFNLYTTILNAAESSKGIVHVKLRPLSDKTRSANTRQDAFWRIAPQTTAKVTFELQDNRWKKLTVEFDRPLTITFEVDTPPAATLQVGKITYKEDGRVRDVFEPGAQSPTTEVVRNGQRAATTMGSYSEALTQLKVVPEVVSLLTDKNLNTGPLRFESVEMLGNSQDNLRVDLRSGTTLQFGINSSNG